MKERIAWAATVTPQMHAEASAQRARVVARMQQLVGPDDVLCLPTSPRAAPLLGTPVDKIEIEYRNQAMCLLCISGLAGLPQLSLPLAHIDGLPARAFDRRQAGCGHDAAGDRLQHRDEPLTGLGSVQRAGAQDRARVQRFSNSRNPCNPVRSARRSRMRNTQLRNTPGSALLKLRAPTHCPTSSAGNMIRKR